MIDRLIDVKNDAKQTLDHLIDVKIDAKQTLDTLNSKSDIDKFKKTIFVPEKAVIEQLLDGTRFFLTGAKGTGKTAFLIYTALKAEEELDAERAFIIFKEFSQEEREDYKRIAHITTYDQNDISPYYDYLAVWNWMFHVAIFDSIMNSDKCIFENDENLNLYLAAIEAVKSNTRGPNRRLPIVTDKGFVETTLEVPIRGATVKLQGRLDFEFDESSKKTIRFSTHVEKLNQLYSNLKDADSQLFIVIDELNLSTKNFVEFDRDIYMIRDMVIAIERFNTLTSHSHGNVRLIGSVRTEVINSIKIRGQEVNKSIESYGIPIDWTKYVFEDLKHPLIRLMINYLRLSENQRQTGGVEDQDIYNRWVDPSINGIRSEQYIRDYTLYRPRDIVRLLNLFRLNCYGLNKISGVAFNMIRRQYSSDCWNEAIEELAITYTFKELEYIQTWLTGSKRITTYEELKERAIANWANKESCTTLLNDFDDLLQQLYKVGILGNRIKIPNDVDVVRQRWYFRGDDTLLLDKSIQIHRIFSEKLSIY